MSSDICDMIVRIGGTMGAMISSIALEEVRRVNPRNNHLNNESHVSL
jgi:CTP synthase (UTP-ammonia lyase)